MINNPPFEFILKKASRCSQDVFTVNDTPIKILSANPNRVSAYFQNNGQHDITLVFGDESTALENKGLIIKKGGSFCLTLINLYTAEISALSTNESLLTCVECTE